ncbi:MAG TPA: orotidine-5'-phosphate decarboxylase [Vicinamibacterales bacterium]|jgi:orotidine-5'-phosphate decarboxylase|nr:orotidine-5'-phosphate decarboxylase [Vicinamibacterales bacterium]
MNQLLVALDVDTADAANALADRLRGVVGGFKIGSRLFTSVGPTFVETLTARGDRVFLDLKFHDIPSTVAGAVAAATRLGVWMVNVHASGGVAMMRAARAAADEEAACCGRAAPLVIAVTMLTSMDQRTTTEVGFADPVADQVGRLAALAAAAGLDGVVASPLEIGIVRRRCGDGFTIVTPGIRDGADERLRGGAAPVQRDRDRGAGAPAGAERGDGAHAQRDRGVGAPGVNDDQQRTLSAADALAAGATYLVVGRPIIAAADPRAAAERIAGDCRAKVS